MNDDFDVSKQQVHVESEKPDWVDKKRNISPAAGEMEDKCRDTENEILVFNGTLSQYMCLWRVNHIISYYIYITY